MLRMKVCNTPDEKLKNKPDENKADEKKDEMRKKRKERRRNFFLKGRENS